jgi:ubiquinone/menaquinone biosynthesis C-methylase UbiE
VTTPADADRATRDRYATAESATRYVSELDHPVARVITAGEHRAVRRAVASLGGPPNDGCWLDVAGGSGTLASADVSRPMLARDRSGSPAIVADARALPLADGAVDVVVVLRLLHRCSDDMVRIVVAEGLRAARLGVVISDTLPTPVWRSVLRRMLGRSPVAGGRTRDRLRSLVVDGGGRIAVDVATVPLLSSEHVVLITAGLIRDFRSPNRC